MIPINGEKLALVYGKPKKGLRYKTVSVSGWWLMKTTEKAEGTVYGKEEVKTVKAFVVELWKRGYRKTMEQLVRGVADQALVDCFYKSTSLKEFTETEPSLTVAETLPVALYQKRSYSVYHLCHDLVGKEVCVVEDLVGEYNKITDWIPSSGQIDEKEWRKVLGVQYNQQRANISLILDGPRSRCIIKDGTLNMSALGVRGLEKKLPRGVKVMDLVIEGEELLDLTKLPLTSRSDFSRRLPSDRLAKVVAELEYAKMARKQFVEGRKNSTHPYTPGRHKTESTYRAACLEIKTKFKPTTLISSQGKNWKRECKRLAKEKSKLVFEIFAKKLWTWQEPKAQCVVGCQKTMRVGPEKILIDVKIENISNKEIKV